MYAIQGEFRQFCFDRAVFTFGRALESELNGVKGKNQQAVQQKRDRMLAKWLDQPLKFRAPQATTTASPTADADVTETTQISGKVN